MTISNCALLRRVGKVAKSDYKLRYVCLSVCPRGTNRLSLDGLS